MRQCMCSLEHNISSVVMEHAHASVNTTSAWSLKVVHLLELHATRDTARVCLHMALRMLHWHSVRHIHGGHAAYWVKQGGFCCLCCVRCIAVSTSQRWWAVT